MPCVDKHSGMTHNMSHQQILRNIPNKKANPYKRHKPDNDAPSSKLYHDYLDILHNLRKNNRQKRLARNHMLHHSYTRF